MKQLFLTIMFVLFTATILLADQTIIIQEKADRIANAIRVPLYGYDLGSVASVIESMIDENDEIRAVDIFDINSEKIIFEAYKTNDNLFHSNKSIPKRQKETLRQFIHPIINEGENIGELHLYYISLSESATNLTAEELSWINANPVVRIGNEMDWPPFDFVEEGKPAGYSIDFIRLVSQKVGLKIKFINDYTWKELVNKLKSGEIDVLPAIYKTEDRKSFFSFTTSYFSQPSVMVVNSNNNDVKTLKDLSGKRLAAIKGFAITEVMAAKHPEIELFLVDALLDGIMAVSTGQADAFIDSIGNIFYLVDKNFIPNVKFISDISLREVENPSLHIGVPKNRKVLRDILQKGMEAVTKEETAELRDRWLEVFDRLDKKQTIPDLTKTDSSQKILWVAVLVVATFLAFLIFGTLISRADKSQNVNIQFGTQKFRWITILALGLFIIIVILVSWLTLEQNKQKILAEVENNLQSTLLTTWERMHIWVEGKQNFLKQLGRDQELAATVNGLIKNNRQTKRFVTNFDQSNISSIFHQVKEDLGNFNYFIVDGNANNIASSNRASLGGKNELFKRKPKLMEMVFRDQIIFIPPVHLVAPEKRRADGSDDVLPTMFVAGPLKNASGKTIAIILQQIDPSKGFSKVLQFSRVGESGESYAFNAVGRLLSESRFDNDLRQIGLIAPEDHGILTIEIRDPGGNMVEGYKSVVNRIQQPLTLMARNAIEMRGNGVRKGQGFVDNFIQTNLKGYNDYRGVPVVGAWIWDDDLDVGITSEMDVAEALSLYKLMRLTVVGILGFTMLILVGITFFVLLVGERTSRILIKARNELENKVRERTQELENANQRVQSIVDVAMDMIITIDEAQNIVLFNPAAEKTFGYRAQEVIGKPMLMLLPERVHTFHEQEVNKFKHEKIKARFVDKRREIAGRRKDGTEFPAEATISRVELDGHIFFTAFARDITERKHAEGELRKLSLAIEQSQVTVVITDLEGIIEYVNPKFCAVTGYGVKEVLGQNPRILNAGIQSSEYYKTMWDKIKQGEVWKGEFANKKKNGDIYWENAVISPIRDDKEIITHFVAVKEDVTEKKRAGEALRENEEMLSKITSSALTAIIMIVSDTGKISFWNQAAERIFGWKADEVIGQKLDDFIIPGQYQTQYIEGLKYFKKEGKGPLVGHSTEISTLNKDGIEFPIELNLSAVKIQGKWNAIGLITDITDRKRSEQELKDAKLIAEEATQAKSDFLANMSHEIRTPMNAIIGMSHLCLGTELQPRQQDYIEKVYTSAQSLLGIINDILDFSKIEAGMLEVELIPFRLDEVLNNLANLIAIKAQEKDLELLFDAHPDVPRALIGDPLRLGQILLNLAGNAVKFTEEGELIIRTELVQLTDEKAEIKFTVKDTGIGMTQKQVEKLFQSFSQADTSTTRKYGGTGLGLTISKKLTELMKGRIWVKSEPGVGSSFIFTAVFNRSLDMEKTIGKEAPKDLENLKVLVVDDIKSTRDMIKATLESFSFIVTCVESGKDALTELENAPPDDPFQLVLMDWKMPGMDGIEASRQIKKHSTLINIPTIIMITAYGREEVVQEAEQVGLEGFLIKPMTPSTLLDTIMQVFGEKGGFKKVGRLDKEWKIQTRKTFEGCHVLLAEDNKINQQVAEELLIQAGIEVTTVNNGKEAIEIINHESFDAVLMDLQMPVMDGFEATRNLRSNTQFKQLPIIAMTANAMAKDREKCFEAGMNDHIPKPIDPNYLFKTLEKYLKSKVDKGVVKRKEVLKQTGQELWLPEEFDGIDIRLGLKHIGNNRNLYHKLLINFFNDHRNDISILEKEIENGHWDTAQRMAHTLKGVAGTIGAEMLQLCSERMETAIINRTFADYSSLLSNLEKEMEIVMKGLEKFAVTQQKKVTDKNREKQPIDAEAVVKLLNEVNELIEEMDPEAEEKVNQIKEYLNERPYSNLVIRLSKQVHEFEFDDASTTVLELKEMIADNL